MKNILGFTMPTEGENQAVLPKKAETMKPIRCMVKIRFPGIHKELEYYNDRFPLKVGDVVSVSGKLAQQPGQITEVITKFCIHTKDYERVLRVLDVRLHGHFSRIKVHMVCFDDVSVTPERFESWIKPPTDPTIPKFLQKEDHIVRGEGYILDIHNAEHSEDMSKLIWNRGVDYYNDGNLKYLSVKDGVGVAYLKGEKWYRVDFRIDENGLMTDIYCDCPYMGLCKHEAAVAYALKIIWDDNHYTLNSAFTALDREIFWRLVALAEQINL